MSIVNTTKFGYYVTKAFNTRMENKLKTMRASWPLESFDQLADALKSYNMVITGSFPLGVVTNSDYTSGDIDFVTYNNEKAEQFKKVLVENKWEKYEYSGYNHLSIPLVSVKYKKGDIIISIITLTRPDKSIYDIFDLDLCTLNFNGTEWQMTGLADEAALFDKKMRIYIGAIHMVDGEYLLNLSRLTKYQKRGFTITNLDEVKNDIVDNLGDMEVNLAYFWKCLFKHPQKGWFKAFKTCEKLWPVYNLKKCSPNDSAFKDYYMNFIKTTDRQYLEELYDPNEVDLLLGVKKENTEVTPIPDVKKGENTASTKVLYKKIMKISYDDINTVLARHCKRHNFPEDGTRYSKLAEESFRADIMDLYEKFPGFSQIRPKDLNVTSYSIEQNYVQAWNNLTLEQQERYAEIEKMNGYAYTSVPVTPVLCIPMSATPVPATPTSTPTPPPVPEPTIIPQAVPDNTSTPSQTPSEAGNWIDVNIDGECPDTSSDTESNTGTSSEQVDNKNILPDTLIKPPGVDIENKNTTPAPTSTPTSTLPVDSKSEVNSASPPVGEDLESADNMATISDLVHTETLRTIVAKLKEYIISTANSGGRHIFLSNLKFKQEYINDVVEILHKKKYNITKTSKCDVRVSW